MSGDKARVGYPDSLLAVARQTDAFPLGAYGSLLEVRSRG